MTKFQCVVDLSVALLAVTLCSTHTMAAQMAPPLYKIVKQVPLGAPDKWDFVSLGPQGKRVYVSHQDKISIVDTETAKLIGTVGPIAGAHGTVVVPSVGRLYADNGKSGTVSVFDAKTLRYLEEIPTQPDSDAMAYDDTSGVLIVSNGDSGTATLIDPKTDKALATFKIGPGGEGIATDGRGHAFINISDGRAMVRIDLAARKVDAHWPLKNCESPHGLAIDRKTQRLFVSCRNKTMLVVDSTNGKTVASLPIGRGTDSAAFDPKRKLAFSSNKDGTISVVAEQGPNVYRALAPIPTAPGAATMAEDPRTGRIYVVTADVVSTLPAHHRGEVPEYAFRPGTVKLLVLDPRS